MEVNGAGAGSADSSALDCLARHTSCSVCTGIAPRKCVCFYFSLTCGSLGLFPTFDRAVGTRSTFFFTIRRKGSTGSKMKAMDIAPLSGKQQSQVRRERAEPGEGGGCPTAPAGLSVQERGSEPTLAGPPGSFGRCWKFRFATCV